MYKIDIKNWGIKTKRDNYDYCKLGRAITI